MLAIALVAMTILLAEKIPPQAMTRTVMNVTEYRIREYYDMHHKLPATLSDLPQLDKNRDSSFHDGWGHNIQYSHIGDCVTLLSLGKDNCPGGTDDNADNQVVFEIGVPIGLPTSVAHTTSMKSDDSSAR
jgi:hypothetical protein